ncbi:uncharacterized protein TRUGW13939_11777 [Talaromyces rugulosus]|uniref:Uncharacterized protein n=1 Tax=Talaromyces rugulosus TaxID=121627 RepID=A0A7H8RDN5_TALRU|nr:uncharacterized protein TRUGW13939_11777 [Talaromyces rugulosus]QKX64602.1 hypothetical protein TRUGW13939_11777 [Talaromyces rugulosus]
MGYIEGFTTQTAKAPYDNVDGKGNFWVPHPDLLTALAQTPKVQISSNRGDIQGGIKCLDRFCDCHKYIQVQASMLVVGVLYYL